MHVFACKLYMHLHALYCFIARVLIDNNWNKRYATYKHNSGCCVSSTSSHSLDSASHHSLYQIFLIVGAAQLISLFYIVIHLRSIDNNTHAIWSDRRRCHNRHHRRYHRRLSSFRSIVVTACIKFNHNSTANQIQWEEKKIISIESLVAITIQYAQCTHWWTTSAPI